MIVFTTFRHIPQELLECKGIREVITYNLSSYFSDVPTLEYLIPSLDSISEDLFDNEQIYSNAFDTAYINQILASDVAFLQLMQIVIQLLISESNYRDIITESLSKFIQQRYGYNTHIARDVEDFLNIEESSFSIPGLFVMDLDIDRYQALTSDLFNPIEE